MKSFFQLIRYKNLLFIAGLQWLMRYSVILPILNTFKVDKAFIMSDLQFGFLLLATVCIAAAGYVINDYFDTKIDGINRPDTVIVGKTITKKQASLLHQALTGIGVALGLFVAFQSQNLSLGFIILLVPGLLWFYSASYKRQFLLGNIIVALHAAFVPLLIVIAEMAFLRLNTDELIFATPIPISLYGWVSGFAAFAFITTLMREIIKDMEDVKGDREMESRTMPIVWGIKKTKVVLYLLIAFTITALLFVQFNLINSFDLLLSETKSTLSIRYIFVGLLLPFAYLVYLLIKAKNTTGFHYASSLLKFIMVVGSLYSLVFYFLLAKAQDISLFNLFIINQG